MFLLVSNDYHQTQIALYRGDHCATQINDAAQKSSKYLIPLIKELLEKNNVALRDLNFIAANQGPGKFTSLRVLLATVNGLSFATKIPLIGIDGITTMLDEYHQDGITVALLNAFNNDVFFGVSNHDQPHETGYKNIETLLNELKNNYSEKITVIGDGISLFHDQIKDILDDQAIISSDYPKSASLDFIAKIALKKWKEGDVSEQLMPLYLKKPHYKKAM